MQQAFLLRQRIAHIVQVLPRCIFSSAGITRRQLFVLSNCAGAWSHEAIV